MRTLPAVARPHLANNWHLFVGNPDVPEQEADMLARSPITRVDHIRTPLLVVQGANDDSRVVQAESDNLVEALRARGVEVEYMVKDDEGHGCVNDENVIDLYRAVERFPAEHLGGRRVTMGMVAQTRLVGTHCNVPTRTPSETRTSTRSEADETDRRADRHTALPSSGAGRSRVAGTNPEEAPSPAAAPSPPAESSPARGNRRSTRGPIPDGASRHGGTGLGASQRHQP
jgi:hypothetical protein